MRPFVQEKRFDGGGRENRFGGRKSFGGGGNRDFGDRKSFGGGDYQKREMFETVCDNCGKDCKVPFKPTGEKPVYCSDCYDKMKGGDDRSERSERRFEERRPFKRDFDRNESRSERPSNDNSKVMEQLNSLNFKLDKLIKALETKEAPAKVEAKPAYTDYEKDIGSKIKKATKKVAAAKKPKAKKETVTE
jgi:CxxC-x17-CxxC domain-containing protein